MTRAALALIVLVAGCSAGGRGVGKQPSWRTGGKQTVGPVTFAPSSTPATRYNEPLQTPPPSALGDAVIAAVREEAVKAHLPMPAADARLFRAFSELAEVMPESGMISYNVVEYALQRHGIIEPSPNLLIVWGNVDDPSGILEQLRPALAEGLAGGVTARLGVGWAKRQADGTGVVVCALQASGLATSPIPRQVPAGATVEIDAVVDSRYRAPELFVTRSEGNTELTMLETGRSGAFKAKFSCGKSIGRQQVEITASDANGSTVLANFPVWCGANPPLAITVEPTPDDGVVTSADDAEKRLLALLNRDRTAANLPALIWDDRVAVVSRSHSGEMRKTKLVAHILPTTGSAADRLRVANIRTAAVLENVARAYGVGEAHAALMNSPGHRANMMSAAATHVGIGVILGEEISGRREVFLTQVFIRIPPKLESPRVAEIVRQRMNAVRPISVNATLSSAAQEVADGLAAGKKREQLWPNARKKVETMTRQYARVGSVITVVADVDTIDGKQLLDEYKPDDIGVGIAQGNHPEIGEGAIYIVVLMAEKLPEKKPR